MILSNELINIWTHGGMGIFLFFMMLYDQVIYLPSLHAKLFDHFIFLSFTICLLVSPYGFVTVQTSLKVMILQLYKLIKNSVINSFFALVILNKAAIFLEKC